MTKQRLLEELTKLPHPTPVREAERIVLKWELEREACRRRISVLRRAELLFKAYAKNGSMTVMLLNGRQFTDRPEYGGSAVQHVRNAASKAEAMALLSIRSNTGAEEG